MSKIDEDVEGKAMQMIDDVNCNVAALEELKSCPRGKFCFESYTTVTTDANGNQ